MKYQWSTLKDTEEEIMRDFPTCKIVSKKDEYTELECELELESESDLEAIKKAHKKAEKISPDGFQVMKDNILLYDY